MSFTLRSISVYGESGECRTIKFDRYGLNVLTGQSKTGKSSIIDILDYCFGRDECYVAEGIIRQYISWFGVEIENKDDVLFVGRRNPAVGKRTSPDIYIRRGQHAGLPRHSDLSKNTTEEALIRLLTRFTGISENENRPITGTRRPSQATIRHALFLCFQKQDEIASRNRLFHRQGEEYIPQTIKDTIPYFLGAIDQEHFQRQNELDDTKKQLRQLEVRRELMNKEEGTIDAQTRRIILEARRVGLVDHNFEPSNIDLALQELKRVSGEDLRSPTLVTDSREVITQLENEVSTLHDQLKEVQSNIQATQYFIRQQTSYSTEVFEQRARLVSLRLYKGSSITGNVCPLCETHLESPVPAAKDLSDSLQLLDKQLEAVSVEQPHLQKQLDVLSKKRKGIEEAIVSAQDALERAYADDEKARLQRDHVIERARVVGRISAFLDQTTLSDETNALDIRIEEVRQRIKVLLDQVSKDDVDERVFTFVNLIGELMTRYAQDLSLEHSENRIRLDLSRLSVVAETKTGPISLSRIGSGENWVGYHVVTLLALHHWFREQNCAVPGILVFDQPSQAHYPPDVDQNSSVDSLTDADRQAVYALFKFLHSASESIKEPFQLIVLDHARFDDEWFKDAIVEEWREDKALVPVKWTTTFD